MRANARQRVAAFTLERHPAGSLIASPQASSRLIPSSRQWPSIWYSQVARGRPLGLFHVAGVFADRTWYTGSCVGRRAMCPKKRSLHSRSRHVASLTPVSCSNLWFDTKSFHRYPRILRRDFVTKALRRVSKEAVSVHVSAP